MYIPVPNNTTRSISSYNTSTSTVPSGPVHLKFKIYFRPVLWVSIHEYEASHVCIHYYKIVDNVSDLHVSVHDM